MKKCIEKDFLPSPIFIKKIQKIGEVWILSFYIINNDIYIIINEKNNYLKNVYIVTIKVLLFFIYSLLRKIVIIIIKIFLSLIYWICIIKNIYYLKPLISI